MALLRSICILLPALVFWSCNSEDRWPKDAVPEGSRVGRDGMIGQDGTGPVDGKFFKRKPCSATERAGMAGVLDTLCAQNIPLNAVLWFRGNDGGPCYCVCEELAKLHPSRRDTLHAYLLARENATYAKAARNMKPTQGPSLEHRSLRRDTSAMIGTAQTAAPACNRRRKMVPFQSGCIKIDELASWFQDAWPVFSWEVDAYSGDWPRSVPTGVEPSAATLDEPVVAIYVPREFWYHEDVGGELIAFMLAHEISHGIATGPRCATSSDGFVCEGQCDWWAGNRVMREVFDDEDYVSIMEEAAAQLARYYDAIYGCFAECGYAACSGTEWCGYPPKTCRVKTIDGALRTDPRRPRCVKNWPDHLPGICAEEECP